MTECGMLFLAPKSRCRKGGPIKKHDGKNLCKTVKSKKAMKNGKKRRLCVLSGFGQYQKKLMRRKRERRKSRRGKSVGANPYSFRRTPSSSRRKRSKSRNKSKRKAKDCGLSSMGPAGRCKDGGSFKMYGGKKLCKLRKKKGVHRCVMTGWAKYQRGSKGGQ